MSDLCVVEVYRQKPSSIGRTSRNVMERCGRPAKGHRMAGAANWPVCGIHLRSQRGMIETAPGRFKALGHVTT